MINELTWPQLWIIWVIFRGNSRVCIHLRDKFDPCLENRLDEQVKFMQLLVNMKIDWASLTVGGKFAVFALFYFVFGGNFPSTSPRGAYIWRGDLTEGFLRYRFGGLIFGGAYTWKGLFSEFYGNPWDLSQSKTKIYFDGIERQWCFGT